MTSSVSTDGYPGASDLVMDDIEVLGIVGDVESVTINGEDAAEDDWEFDGSIGVCFMFNLGLT